MVVFSSLFPSLGGDFICNAAWDDIAIYMYVHSPIAHVLIETLPICARDLIMNKHFCSP